MIGRTVSHYEILEQLGAGGMGVVYKARDTRLGRIVALKFLPPQFRDDEMRQRFLREAQAAANLDHPSICTIHDIDEAPDVGPFIVMGYYAGQTLRDKLRQGPVSTELALRWARQILDGLIAAHAEGVVHRDIKPANVLVTDRDEVKILDFGLAKVAGATQVTRTGTTLGTLGYMSPEQLAGGEIGQQTDIWAFGVLLVEMLAGTSPFAGKTEGAVIHNILHGQIPEPTKLRAGLPPELDRIVGRCLARDVGERYTSAQQVAADLDALPLPGADRSAAGLPGPASGEDPTLPAVTAVTAVTAVEEVGEVAAVEPEPAEALAVLDFLNYSGDADTDWLSSGIAESVTVDSKKLVPMPVVARGRVAQAVAARGDVPRDEAAARELGETLGARWVVWGGFQRAGEALRVTAHFLDTTESEPVGSVKLDGTMTEVFELQDRIIESLADGLDVVLADSRKRRVGSPRTSDLEAFEHCARGRQLIWQLDPSNFGEAKASLEKAIEIDPSYALAYSGLGQLFSMRFIRSTDREDLDRAIENLQRATELDQELADPHLWLAYDYARLGRFEEAIAHGRQAVELDAEESMGHYFLGVAYWLQAQLEHRRGARVEALRHMLRTLELAPGGPESGLAAARALAGGDPGGDGALLIRGGDPDPKQVLLDGIPIHTPFHLGGLVEAMDTSLLGGVSDYPGAAPAPVLGGLSRVTSLTTRAPSSERIAGQVAADAVSAGGRIEGPLGGGVSALLSGRGLHGAGARILDGTPLPYGYGEAILRIDAAPSDDHRLAM
ncbi:MAG: protein kinase, partial [Gemmatimonadota bacterium]|nr:protein kinase [Gemmatimonadota bacterium]